VRAHARSAAARALLDERLGRQNIGLVSKARARVLLAELALEMGDTDVAVAEARGAREDAGAEKLAAALAHGVLADALLAAGDAQGALDAARGEVELLEGASWDVELIRALSRLTRALDAARRHDEAAETFDRARVLLDALPAGTDALPLEAALRG
jgi:hypothetical protein